MNRRNYLYLFFLIFSCNVLAMKRAVDDALLLKKRHKGILSLFDSSVADKARSVIDCWKLSRTIKARGIALDAIVGIGGPKGVGKSFLAQHLCNELALVPVYENGSMILAHCSDPQGKPIMPHLYHSIDMIFKKPIPVEGKSIIWIDNAHFLMNGSIKMREIMFNIFKDQLSILREENHDVLLLLEFNNENHINRELFERNCHQSFMIYHPSACLRKLILNHHMNRIATLYAQPELIDHINERIKNFLPKNLVKLAELTARQAIVEAENTQDPLIVTSDHFLQALALMGVPKYEEKQKEKESSLPYPSMYS